MMSGNGNPAEAEGLLPREGRALEEYDAWVEADLSPRSGRLVRAFLAIGVAATIVIAVVLAWAGGDEAPKKDGEDGITNAAAAQQTTPTSTAEVRLTYRLPADLDDAAVEQVAAAMRHRLGAMKIKASVSIAGERGHRVIVLLSALTPEKMAMVKRLLVAPGTLLLATEATPEELADPEDGVGPDFDPTVFVEEQMVIAKTKRAYSPDRFGSLYSGEIVPLYRNPADPTRPVKPGDRPAFVYYPPRWWKPTGGEGEEQRVRGRKAGVVVHLKKDHVMAGAGFAFEAKKFRGRVRFWYELKPDLARRYFEFTRKHLERNLSVIVNGRVATSPRIASALPGSGMFGGMGGEQEIRELVATLRFGPLMARPILVGEDAVGEKKSPR